MERATVTWPQQFTMGMSLLEEQVEEKLGAVGSNQGLN
jgi:hypothetical protein